MILNYKTLQAGIWPSIVLCGTNRCYQKTFRQ